MLILNIAEIILNLLVLGVSLCFWMLGIFMALMLVQLAKDSFTR
jgi:hypothetical protein